MSLRILTPCGIVGKLPSAGDFLRLNVNAAIAGALDTWCSRELAALEDHEPNWRDTFLEAPSWRFTIEAGVAGPQPLAGVIAPSRDSADRLFPCIIVAPLSDLSATTAPASTPWFDAVEASFESARAGLTSGDVLAASLADRGGPRQDDVDLMTVRARSTADGLFMEIQGGPDGRATTMQAVLETSHLAPESSLWWRHDAGRTKVLMTPGLPGGVSFAALFHTQGREAATHPASALTVNA